ncbi:unnamed protein product, partial [Meganyctiphanes norvegica]
MTCVVDDNSDMAQFLLKRGEAPNVGCGVNATPPLVEGAWRGYLEVCHILLQYDANPEEADSRGFHAIYTAAQQGHQEIIQLIINFGGDPHQTRVGTCITPAQHARNNGHINLATWLETKRKLSIHKAK